MYNEEDNVLKTLSAVKDSMQSYNDYEILAVNDGSKDNTLKLLKDFASKNPEVRVLENPVNMGMGKALRTGFENATGDIVVSIDADLSYSADHILKLASELMNDESLDIVLASPYMEGGKVKNVPFVRLFVSKVANLFVGFSIPGNLSTVTCVLRAYRKEVLDSMELESNGTEINLEILSKANANHFRIKEVPAVLEGRELGQSKLKFKAKTISHVLFSFYEKPMMLFGAIGLVICFIGAISALYLFKRTD